MTAKQCDSDVLWKLAVTLFRLKIVGVVLSTYYDLMKIYNRVQNDVERRVNLAP